MKRGAALLALAAALALSGCGSRKALTAKPGTPPVPVAYGADKPATSDAMVEPSTQARPDRNVEPLLRSMERKPDPFDLPPQ